MKRILASLISTFAVEAALSAAETTLDFEDFDPGTFILRQYEPQGVRFWTDMIIMEAVPPGTESGTRALAAFHHPDLPDHPGPITFFTPGAFMQRVQVHVGLLYDSGQPDTEAVLRAFDVEGELLEAQWTALGSGPAAITRVLEIDRGAPEIAYCDVYFLRRDTIDGTDVEIDDLLPEVIDDLTIEGETPANPPPNDPPVVRITDPADGALIFGTGAIELRGTVSEGGLGGLTLLWTLPDENRDLGRFDLNEERNFTQGLTLHPGRNTLRVDALDALGATGSDVITVNYANPPELWIAAPAWDDRIFDAAAPFNEVTVWGWIYKPFGSLRREEVTLSLDASFPQNDDIGPVAVDRLEGVAPDYTFVTVIRPSIHFEANGFTITVRATDEGGSVGQDTVDINLQAPDQVRVASFWTTQASREPPRVAGRKTVARLVPDTVHPRGATINNLSAEVRGFRDGVELAGSPLSPDGITSLDIDSADSVRAREFNQEKSWNFVLPFDWTTEGEIELRAVIDPDNLLNECEICTPNNEEIIGVRFVEGERLTIRPLRVNFPDDGVRTEPSDNDIDRSMRRVWRVYPYGAMTERPTRTFRTNIDYFDDIEDNQEEILEDVYDSNYSCFDSDVANFEDFWDDAFGALWDQTISPCRWHEYFIAFLPESVGIDGPTGISFPPSPGGIAEVGGDGWGGAHELGHAFGLEHAGNDHDEDDGGGFNEHFPYEHGGIGDVAFDPEAMIAVPPSAPYPPDFPSMCCSGCADPASADYWECHTHDLMSYGDPPTWISQNSWWRVFASGFTGQTGPLGAPGPRGGGVVATRVVHLKGRVRDNGSLVLKTPYTLAVPETFAVPEGSGTFEARALNAQGQIVASHRFDGIGSSRHHGRSLHFASVIPFPEDAARVELYRDGALLEQKSSSAHAPEVILLAPNGGETFASEGTLRIEWAAADADGDPLRAAVKYTPNDGETWITLGTEISGSELEVELRDLAGGAGGRVRVMVTDGLLTARDSSDAVFSVGDKAPFVIVQSPESGRRFRLGDIVRAEGSADDPEDGILADDRLRWSSDRDGALGTGRQVESSRLSLGLHTITLEAEDSTGARGSDTVQIEIVTDGLEPSLDIPEAVVPGCGATTRVPVFLDTPEPVAGLQIALGWSDGEPFEFVRIHPGPALPQDRIQLSSSNVEGALGPRRAIAAVALQAGATVGPGVRLRVFDIEVRPRDAAAEGASARFCFLDGVGAPSLRTLVTAARGGESVSIYPHLGCGVMRVRRDCPQSPAFRRGDATGDGQYDISDGIRIFGYLFLGAEAPPCLEAANADDSVDIDITDGIVVLNHLFLGRAPPAFPGPDVCGSDPPDSGSNVGCKSPTGGCQ